MIQIDIRELIPEFLLNERTGRALAKAIERAFSYADAILQEGVDTVLDIEKMPEWRLDEMAWEYNVLYDYDAGIDAKRSWIRDAAPMYRIYGTPEAIYQYLRGMFDDVDIEEWWQYPADPYHFRITVTGDWTDEKIAWVKKAVQAAKNLRSVCDDIALGSNHRILARCETQWWRYTYPMTGQLATGTWPEVNTIGHIERVRVKAKPDVRGYKNRYKMTGTIPEPNIIARISDTEVRASPEVTPYLFTYPMTGDSKLTGTEPQINTVGAIDRTEFATDVQARAYVIHYPMCGTRRTGQRR